jgi:hypothetical protein
MPDVTQYNNDNDYKRHHAALIIIGGAKYGTKQATNDDS